MKNMSDDWPFEASRREACFTRWTVLDGAPILEVYHDLDDGAWQFHGAGDGEPALVALEEIYEIDPTIGELHDLPEGWRAIRSDPDSPWVRSRHSR